MPTDRLRECFDTRHCSWIMLIQDPGLHSLSPSRRLRLSSPTKLPRTWGSLRGDIFVHTKDTSTPTMIC
jgi:hypothetical protein